MAEKRSRDRDSSWQNWAADGRLATGAWFIVFCAYLGFRLANIDAPELTNAFVTITGIWVGNLGIAQSKKVSRVEEKVQRLHDVALKEHPDDEMLLDPNEDTPRRKKKRHPEEEDDSQNGVEKTDG